MLPAKRGSKHPGSVVGKDWPSKSTRDPQVIASLWAATDYGIALDLGRSGLIALDVDRPEDVPAWLLTAIGEAQAPYQATRPDAAGRGHYIYRQPEGRRIGCGKGGLAGMGLDVKGAGGVIIAQPTVHPEGGEYRWIRMGEIPTLPDEIAEKLGDTGSRESAATDAEVEKFLDTHTGNERPQLINTWRNKFAEALRLNESRHEKMVSIMPRVCEEARAGLYPARAAIEMLRNPFMSAFGGDDDRITKKQAASEFAGILAWSIAQAEQTPVERIRASVSENLARADGLLSLSVTTDRSSAGHTAPAIGRSVALLTADDIEDDVPDWVWTVGGIGRIQQAVLSLFAGRPGAGKSTAARWFASQWTLGTLDGIWAGQPQNVAYIASEESLKYVVKPGLRAAGADMKRIFFPKVTFNGEEAPLIAQDDEK